jgi:allantoate deiminase
MAEMIKSIHVDASRLEYYVAALAAFGWQPEGGIIRPVYSPAWVQAREQLAEWMHTAGLDVRGDAMGNLFGRLRGARDDSRTILTGSHLDTVKLGGKFDGALGILSALVALQALREQAGQPQRSLEVVALCEEEGSRFPARYWGTRGMLGLIRAEELNTLRDDAGITIAQAMRAAGLSPERYQDAIRTDIDAFIELHIEQGRILYDEKIDIGIVQAITGIQHQAVTVEGQADHAGTTPMHLRRDAFQGAALMAIESTRLIEQEGWPAVVTMGMWDVKPGAVNIVPGKVRFSVDLRHPQEATKQRLAAAIRARGEAIAQERGLTISITITADSPPANMDQALQDLLRRSAQACGATWKWMTSGAGHDSQVMARYLPAAMLFVPSVEGRSHSAAEYTTIEDATRGASVLATALYQLAYH